MKQIMQEKKEEKKPSREYLQPATAEKPAYRKLDSVFQFIEKQRASLMRP